MPTSPASRSARLPRLLLAIALRSGALVALSAVYTAAAPTLLPDDDGLGTGLLWFTILLTLCGTLGLVDGFLHRYDRLAVIWVVTGTLVAIATVVTTGHDGDAALLVDDLRESGPFLACLVALPALAGGAFVAVVRAATTRTAL